MFGGAHKTHLSTSESIPYRFYYFYNDKKINCNNNN